MNQSEKLSALDASGRTYGASRMPKWRIGLTDWMAYLDMCMDDGEEQRH